MSRAHCYRFADFVLDIPNRSLARGGVTAALNARYFDALALLVREHGQLLGKQRFFDEVWGDTVVTDAALTQCIKELRRLLGDEAGAPRFIRTVPGHGYCFIAPVREADDVPGTEPPPAQARPAHDGEAVGAGAAHPPAPAPHLPPGALRRWLVEGTGATLGGAAAGVLGGLLYGSVLAFSSQGRALGTLSVLLVMLALTVLVGMAGAFGVGFGLASGRLAGRGAGWMLAGAAIGGLLVGGLARLLGSDAFTLLVGRAPTALTGGLEGAVVGLAVASGLLLGGGLDAARGWRPAWCAAALTGLAGALIPLAGGSMMGSSLAGVAAAFDGSRLDMASLGRLVGDPQFGVIAPAALGALEGLVFGGCLAVALLLARRRVLPAP